MLEVGAWVQTGALLPLTDPHGMKGLKNIVCRTSQYINKILNFLLQRSPRCYTKAGCPSHLWVQLVLVKNIWEKLYLD